MAVFCCIRPERIVLVRSSTGLSTTFGYCNPCNGLNRTVIYRTYS
ncbi:hypothetical protein [Leptolyngbya sp. NK1-12]|nr:hypothetical protein [Leptolyngbya sp. NK1-12]